MIEADNRFNCDEFNDFLIEKVYLEDVSVTIDSIKFHYLLDSESVDCYHICGIKKTLGSQL